MVMLGALASSLKLTFGSSREGTQPLLPTSQQPTSDSSSLYATSPPSGRPGEHAQQPWWSADAVYLVTEAPDPQDPASASPVLIRTTHGEVLAVFEVMPPAYKCCVDHNVAIGCICHCCLLCSLLVGRALICMCIFADRGSCSSTS